MSSTSSYANRTSAPGSFRTLAHVSGLAIVAMASMAATFESAASSSDPDVLPDPQTQGPIVSEEGNGIPAEADGDGMPSEQFPLSQNFRVNVTIPAFGFQEIDFIADEACVNVHLIGSGATNLDLILIDDEAGLIAVAHSKRDQEFISFCGNEPRVLRAIVLNWGKSDNACTLASY